MKHLFHRVMENQRKLIQDLTSDSPVVREKALEKLISLGGKAVNDLIEALKDNQKEIRLGAVQALGEIGDDRALEPLIDLLQQERETEIITAGAEALGGFEQPQAAIQLRKMLAMEPLGVQLKAMESLAHILEVKSIPDLLPLLEEDQVELRQAAARLLGSLEDPRVGEHLVKTLHVQDPRVRAYAVQALGDLGDEGYYQAVMELEHDPDLEVRRQVLMAAGKLGSEQTLERLLPYLEDSPDNLKRAAVKALGELGDSRAVSYLVSYFKDVDQWLDKRTAVNALGKIGDPRALDVLTEALQSGNDRLQIPAAKALGRLGGSEIVRPLLEILDDKEVGFRVQREACKALGRISDPRAVDLITGAFVDTARADLRLALVQALGRIADPDTVDCLQSILEESDEDSRVKGAAVEALGAIRTEQAAYVLVEYGEESELRREVLTALAKFEDTRFLEPILKALTADDLELKNLAARLLGHYGDRRAIQPLRDALLDQESFTKIEFIFQFKVVNALGSLCHVDDVEDLFAEISDENAVWIAHVLNRIDDPKLVETLQERLASESQPQRRIAIILALQIMGVPEGIPLLLDNLSDPVQEVRRTAAAALLSWKENPVSPEQADGTLQQEKKDLSRTAEEIADLTGREAAASLLNTLEQEEGPEDLIDSLQLYLEGDPEERPADIREITPEAGAGSGAVIKENGATSTGQSHYPAPGYREELLERVDKDRVIINKEVIAVEDAKRLLRNGVFNDLVMQNGQPVLSYDFSTLVRVGELDLLKKFVSTRGEEEFPESAAGLIQKTAYWKLLFNDTDKALCCLEKAEGLAEYSHDWLWLAASWKNLFDDDREAPRCLGKAEGLADDSRDWRNLAENWKKLYDDDREARRCLRKAEGLADDSWDWCYLAETWKEFFDDDREARRCLGKADGLADKSRDWRWLAETWKEVFDDDRETRRCLRKAKRLADDSRDWRYLAESWKEVFDDDREARRCLRKAKRLADYSFQWRYLAASWKELFDDEREARRCLGKAEGLADGSRDWGQLTESWKMLFDDDQEAYRCLEKAESLAAYHFEWRDLAESWKEVFDDDREARRCLGKAEALADDSDDWRDLAASWKKLFGNEREARRLLEKGEMQTDDYRDWRYLAASWKEVFDDDLEARRCLEKAEGLAESSSNWCYLAKSWITLFDDDQEARCCLTKGEESAKKNYDWVDLAISYEKLLEDLVKAGYCERMAKEVE